MKILNIDVVSANTVNYTIEFPDKALMTISHSNDQYAIVIEKDQDPNPLDIFTEEEMSEAINFVREL